MAAWTYPAIDPVAFTIGATEVRWYGIAYLAGFVLGVLIIAWLNRQWEVGLDSNGLADILLVAIVSVLLGGRLGYVLFYNAEYYFENPSKIVAVWDGGMAFHGALLALMLGAVIMARRLEIPILRLLDMGAVAAPIGLFLGRLANFVNGELWGRVADVPWAMVFPGAGLEPRHPSQLYEALLEGLLIFAVLALLSRRKRPDGTYIGLFLVMYGVFRFAIEFAREPDVQLGFVAGPLTMGQLLTVPMIAGGAWLLWRAYAASRRSDQAASSTVSPGQDT